MVVVVGVDMVEVALVEDGLLTMVVEVAMVVMVVEVAVVVMVAAMAVVMVVILTLIQLICLVTKVTGRWRTFVLVIGLALLSKQTTGPVAHLATNARSQDQWAVQMAVPNHHSDEKLRYATPIGSVYFATVVFSVRATRVTDAIVPNPPTQHSRKT